MSHFTLASFRLGLVALLVAAWCGYALTVPADAGVAALRAAMSKKVPPKPGAASVSWINGGKPIDPAALEALRQAAGGGKSIAGMIERARELSAKANAKSRRIDMDLEERGPQDEDPAVVVPKMIGYLNGPSKEERALAAMTMCDNTFAKWEGAGEAVPGLEAVVASKDPEGAEFAELALKRIRFWAAKRQVEGAKP